VSLVSAGGVLPGRRSMDPLPWTRWTSGRSGHRDAGLARAKSVDGGRHNYGIRHHRSRSISQSRVITGVIARERRYPRRVSASPEASDPELGTLIGDRYRIVSLLGEGGMGSVYKAEHLQLAKHVAIKLLRPEISSRKDADARFQREAMAGARLQHPNVVGVLDFGDRPDGGKYLVMELLQGDSLRDLLDRTPQLPWPRAVHIARQVLRGLAHAHDQGVIHRDIKPENVYLAHDGEDADFAKLIDFGIAMLTAGEGSDVRLTAAGLAVGTPTYLAPEQAVGGRLGGPTDLYSLSVVLFEMLTGRPPFVADEPVRLLTAHAMTPPPTIAEVAPEVAVPPAIEAVLRRGLAKTWGERIGTATEYIALLDEARRIAAVESSHPDAARYATPVPGTITAALPTPPPTPPTSGDAAVLGTAPTAHALAAAAPTAAPIPTAAPGQVPVWRPSRRQLAITGGVLGGLLVLAVISALVGGDGARVAGSAGTAPIVIPAPVVPVPSAIDRENAYKAAVLDLVEGKTCPERKKAVAKLRQLGDARAIPALKKARSRQRGGVLGIGSSNTNGCLRKDAEAAIVALGGSLK
jgi:serine/threonine protein kinase